MTFQNVYLMICCFYLWIPGPLSCMSFAVIYFLLNSWIFVRITRRSWQTIGRFDGRGHFKDFSCRWLWKPITKWSSLWIYCYHFMFKCMIYCCFIIHWIKFCILRVWFFAAKVLGSQVNFFVNSKSPCPCGSQQINASSLLTRQWTAHT